MRRGSALVVMLYFIAEMSFMVQVGVVEGLKAAPKHLVGFELGLLVYLCWIVCRCILLRR